MNGDPFEARAVEKMADQVNLNPVRHWKTIVLILVIALVSDPIARITSYDALRFADEIAWQSKRGTSGALLTRDVEVCKLERSLVRSSRAIGSIDLWDIALAAEHWMIFAEATNYWSELSLWERLRISLFRMTDDERRIVWTKVRKRLGDEYRRVQYLDTLIAICRG